jgi:hypothetical protein
VRADRNREELRNTLTANFRGPLSFVYAAPVANSRDLHQQLFVVNCVHHVIVTDANALFLFSAFEFLAAGRTCIQGQSFDAGSIRVTTEADSLFNSFSALDVSATR